jgi:hypothetical protein
MDKSQTNVFMQQKSGYSLGIYLLYEKRFFCKKMCMCASFSSSSTAILVKKLEQFPFSV